VGKRLSCAPFAPGVPAAPNPKSVVGVVWPRCVGVFSPGGHPLGTPPENVFVTTFPVFVIFRRFLTPSRAVHTGTKPPPPAAPMQATRTHGPCTLPTGRLGLGDPPMVTNLLLACRTPVFHDLVRGRGVGEWKDGGQDRLATQALVARWEPDTGERQGEPGAASCTHRSRFRSGGPFSRFGTSTPPLKGTRCDAQGASRDPPRSCTPGGCSPPAADTMAGDGRPSKVMLDPVRQGTPCFARFRKGGRLRNVHTFAALSPPATDKKRGKGWQAET
jgi:hypothetical protein